MQFFLCFDLEVSDLISVNALVFPCEWSMVKSGSTFLCCGLIDCYLDRDIWLHSTDGRVITLSNSCGAKSGWVSAGSIFLTVGVMHCF